MTEALQPVNLKDGTSYPMALAGELGKAKSSNIPTLANGYAL